MVNTCCVKDCTSRSSVKDETTFHVIPMSIRSKGSKLRELSEKRRQAWLRQINRKGVTATTVKSWTRVCSRHFITGKPSQLFDEENPDWIPTLNMGYTCKSGNVGRYDRQNKRQKLFDQVETVNDQNTPENQTEVIEITVSTSDSTECCASSQTDMQGKDLVSLESELQVLRTENISLQDKIDKCTFSENFFKAQDKEGYNDEKVKYYTGLPNFLVLNALVIYLSPFLSCGPRSANTKFQDVLLVLMRLRLNLHVQVIADLFHVSQSTVSKIFFRTLDVMYARLLPCIHWPSREDIKRTMPSTCKQHFGSKVTVIIDCFEVFIETPSSLIARAQTFSSYKHHNTIKYLLGITPQGVVSFISKGWGGRASDKWVTENSGFLDNLSVGDLVLADRGFNIHESVGLACAEVRIPAFTKGKKQLSAFDVESTRKIAHVRIHVERVIGSIVQKYALLDSTIPLTFLSTAEGESLTTLDKVVTVCCALVNLCPSVVPFD